MLIYYDLCIITVADPQKKSGVDSPHPSPTEAADTPRSKSLPPKNSAIVLTEDERWRNHYVTGLRKMKDWLVVWSIFIFPYIGNNHPN